MRDSNSSFQGQATIFGLRLLMHIIPLWISRADLLEKAGIVVVPGVGYGPSGENYFRVSMTAPDDRIDLAMERLKTFSKASS